MATTAGQSEAASQNIFGVASDFGTGLIFSLLHAFDDCGIEDSSKNLRVLWVRALLAYRKKIKDDVAHKFLPSNTRSLVTTEWGANILDPILPFAEWIEARTQFIDEGLNHFLSNPLCTDPETGSKLECQVVLLGAGYDTRALRYRHEHGNKAKFIEVDLPSVVEGKSKLYKKFQKEQDPEWNIDKYGSTLVPFDLNDAGGPDPKSLVQILRENGLKKDTPTLFVSEAVLFYVNEGAVRNIMNDFFNFASQGGNGDSERAETLFCFTDTLKPFVDVPFSNEANKWFDANNMDLLQHRSRWGGAVHFALASSRRKVEGQKAQEISEDNDTIIHSTVGNHIRSKVGGLINSYIPTASRNKEILKNPSFENVWYAVAFPWQIDGYDTPLQAVLKRKSSSSKDGEKPFATRLWGEPIVIYRDKQGELVAMADVCPHRSVPLSMGKVNDGNLECVYHGWTFGEKGACVDIPTMHTVDDDGIETTSDCRKLLNGVTKANMGHMRAVVEHEGLVYVWRGNVLEADVSLLPTRRKGDMETVPIDTVLDYNVDYCYVVENNLDSPHLFYLHDGSVPPIESIGMMNVNLPKLKLTSFTDHCGMGHLGRLGKNGRPKKLLRFDPPNVVRHGGVSGFEEEFHCVPISNQRTRVLLRQHLPRGPILSTVTSVPGLMPILTIIVNSWNYHIALEDSNVMQGQASRIEDWGSPRLGVGGLGDDLIKRFWKWRNRSLENMKLQKNVNSPYVDNFDFRTMPKTGGIPSGTSFGDNPEIVNRVRAEAQMRNIPLISDDGAIDNAGNVVGTYGIKQDYIQDLPAANFPPVNYKQYARLLVFDQFVKNIMKRDDDEVPAPTRIFEKESTPALIE
eukprot:CAMPEP_0113314904 /NCGR_PEP_ID=MMETSP0010_2-20120614/10777_1 /TAXON_ID=216773 ORGANISM="Corethron hystrix, Strain 308" /NCGR_SAMPLE_ID=MMETSP0010_2 /ASSEMBLY_ACC=CAM_ASM_000155 /LENGTH=853 /DNA_ID=CAMNT_0000171281 /DNA_START=275 /DNA_END=2836 /DNA_ORIENTATION=+ /assembly_acc=CAM_ASM_000155